MLLQIQAVFPNFDLNSDAVAIWTRFLMEADAEMAAQNLKEHIKESKFAPTIHEIVRRNEHIHVKREKERTRMMIQESERLMLETSTVTPWEKEGISHKDYLRRILGESRGKKNAQS